MPFLQLSTLGTGVEASDSEAGKPVVEGVSGALRKGQAVGGYHERRQPQKNRPISRLAISRFLMEAKRIRGFVAPSHARVDPSRQSGVLDLSNQR